MRSILKFVFLCFLTIPVYVNALVITDVVEINRNASQGVTLDFDLKRGGYNPLTDSITFVKMSYTVKEIIDFDDYEDESTLEGGEEYSMIFDRRSNFRDINTGTYTEQMSWNKSDTCQIGGYDGEPCIYSLDLFGTTAESFFFYTDNLWFEGGRLEVVVDRINLPEPSAAFLLCVGFFGICANIFRQRRTA